MKGKQLLMEKKDDNCNDTIIKKINSNRKKLITIIAKIQRHTNN